MATRDEHEEEPARLGADVDPGDAQQRRLRMSLALALLPNPNEACGDDLATWLLRQPMPEQGQDEDPTDLGVTVSANLDRVIWLGLGNADLFLSRVAEFFDDVNVPDAEYDLLADVGTAISPERFGSWIEARPDGLDGGWIMEEEVLLELAMVAAPRAPLREALLAWAEASEAVECTWIRRSVAPPSPMTEFVIPLPGETPADKLALARDAFERLDVPWIGENVATAIAESAPEGLALVVALTDEGASRVGVVAAGPATALVLALVKATGGAEDQALAAWEATLGQAPGWLACSRYADGFRTDLYYWLSRDD